MSSMLFEGLEEVTDGFVVDVGKPYICDYSHRLIISLFVSVAEYSLEE